MSIPKAVFIDTNVFVSQNFNYESAVLTSFIPVSKKNELKIILPEPISKEIQRHISDRSAEALKALDDARRRAPFLAKWKNFPSKQTSLDQWEVSRVAHAEWKQFLSQFEVSHLGYDGVSVSKIMNWYHSGRAPFGDGKKKKEFPDALAIEIISLYADKHGVCVAVVSDDQDMKRACENFPSLLYFQSLPQLTELLLDGEQKLDVFRAAIEDDLTILRDDIYQEISLFSTYISQEEYEEIDVSIGLPEIDEISIIGIGNKECTVVFEVVFESEHKIKWEEVVDPVEGYTDSYSEWMSQSNRVSGTAKILMDPSMQKIVSVGMIELNSSEIEISRMPRRFRDY